MTKTAFSVFSCFCCDTGSVPESGCASSPVSQWRTDEFMEQTSTTLPCIMCFLFIVVGKHWGFRVIHRYHSISLLELTLSGYYEHFIFPNSNTQQTEPWLGRRDIGAEREEENFLLHTNIY